MAFLPENPRHQTSLLVIILSLAAAALFFMYMYKPKTLDMADMRETLEDLRFQNELAEGRIGSLQELRDQLEQSEIQFERLQQLVPEGPEVPAIYESIATQTQALNLRLLSVLPSAPKADSGDFFLRQDWQMRVEGEYHDFGELLTAVAGFPRIVRPQVQSIELGERTPSGKQLVIGTFGLETFVLPDPRAAVAATRADGGEQ